MSWKDLPPTPLDRYHMTDGGPDWPWALVLAVVFLTVIGLMVLL